MTESVSEIDLILTTLELEGYDEHPEVGQLISETRQLAKITGVCLSDMAYVYGN